MNVQINRHNDGIDPDGNYEDLMEVRSVQEDVEDSSNNSETENGDDTQNGLIEYYKESTVWNWEWKTTLNNY